MLKQNIIFDMHWSGDWIGETVRSVLFLRLCLFIFCLVRTHTNILFAALIGVYSTYWRKRKK